jgi:hypothetical protein
LDEKRTRTLKSYCTLITIAIAVGAACARAKVETPAAIAPASRDAAPNGAIVLRQSDMRTGTLLDALQQRIPQMYSSKLPGSPCPMLTFRGLRTVTAADNPSIYVDGTLMTNTCLLNELSTRDVEAVEVYTSGAAGRAGVQRNPNGVILIFRGR